MTVNARERIFTFDGAQRVPRRKRSPTMNLFDTARLTRTASNAKITEFASFCLTAADRVEVVDYFVHSATGAASVMSRREMTRADARRVYREFQAKGYSVAITARFAA